MKQTFKQFLLEIEDIDDPDRTPSIGSLKKHPDYASNKLRKHIDNINKNPNLKYVGSGVQGYVHKTDDPSQLDRVTRTADREEAGTMYLKFIYEHPQLKQNPFFPRVLDVTRPNSDVPSYHIEKLYPIDSPAISKEFKDALMKKYFIMSDVSDHEDPIEYARDLAFEISSAVTYGELNIKDPQLKQAVLLIRKIRSILAKTGLNPRIDIHRGNIMWRMTNLGPQLVITDPLFFAIPVLTQQANPRQNVAK